MKQGIETKAYQLRLRAGIQRDQHGNYIVPSSSSDALHIVSKDGLCSCPAMKAVCSHTIAAFGAHVPLIQFAWSSTYSELMLVAEVHRAAIQAMPVRLQAYLRQEFRAARERLQPVEQKAA
jgi:hypothetical protein